MATQKVVVGGSSVTAGQMKDFWRQVDDGSVTFDTFQAYLEHRNPFDATVLNWAKVYETLGMSAEYAEFVKTNAVALAVKPGLWTVPVLKGVTCNKLVAAFKKLGVTVYQYTDDLDASVTKNDRDPNKTGSYTVSFAANVEADESFKNLSANQLKEQGILGITLMERLLLELGYFLTTGSRHLDVANVTLCTGSRRSDGLVPGVLWGVVNRELCVRWCRADDARDLLRTRAVVS